MCPGALQHAREAQREAAIRYLLGEELLHVSMRWQREREARLLASELRLARQVRVCAAPGSHQ